MIYDVLDKEEDRGDVHLEWIRHEDRGAQGTRILHYTLCARRGSADVALNTTSIHTGAVDTILQLLAAKESDHVDH